MGMRLKDNVDFLKLGEKTSLKDNVIKISWNLDILQFIVYFQELIGF